MKKPILLQFAMGMIEVASRAPGETPRHAWKRSWRLFRIFVRESWKAQRDMLIYGTSCMTVDPTTREARCIPPSDVWLKIDDDGTQTAHIQQQSTPEENPGRSTPP